MTMTGSLDRSDPPPSLAWLAYRPGPWLALVAAPLLLIAPFIEALAAGDWAQTGTVVLLAAAFGAAVVWPFGARRRPGPATELSFLALLLVCTGYFVLWRGGQALLFPLLAVAASLAIRRRWAMGVVGSTAVTGAVAVGVETGSVAAGVLVGFAAFAGGAGNFLVQYYVALSRELDRTRERLAVAAVADERLRFARDLHDLLGHSLSIIAVKSEVARRLMPSDPQAASTHVAEVEEVARDALDEVRSVVSGARSMRLAEQLASARRVLEDAGIAASIVGSEGTLPIVVDATLGWVVREAATNVVRHSGAHRCTITVEVTDGAASVEIVDDGAGSAAAAGSAMTGAAGARRAAGAAVTGLAGTGLAGLRERVESAGGEFTVASSPGGFRVTAVLPLSNGART